VDSEPDDVRRFIETALKNLQIEVNERIDTAFVLGLTVGMGVRVIWPRPGDIEVKVEVDSAIPVGEIKYEFD
jgi:hypothetical protein